MLNVWIGKGDMLEVSESANMEAKASEIINRQAILVTSLMFAVPSMFVTLVFLGLLTSGITVPSTEILALHGYAALGSIGTAFWIRYIDKFFLLRGAKKIVAKK